MCAKRFLNGNSFDKPVTVETRKSKLELSTNTVSIHKNGIEFRSPTPFTEWAEMTVSLHSPVSGHKVACTGVIVACTGNKHLGYHVSMIFTSLSAQAEKQLGAMARSEFGAG
ncbi:MAG: PilZ domain-containing protein [Verrucomicrobiota bacterium]|jgi:hypothetical protein